MGGHAPSPWDVQDLLHGDGSTQAPSDTPTTGASGTDDAAAEIARLKAQIETLKENNSPGNDNSAMAAQIESTVLNAISAHLADLADDEEE